MSRFDPLPRAAKGASQTVLLVEDNLVARKLVRRLLSLEGFSVVEAPDGAAALRSAAERAPDLVLQDLRLPDCDGFELPTHLRALAGMKDVPIVAFSGTLDSSAGRVAAVGFDGLLPKPIESTTLVQTVRRLLSPPVNIEPYGKGRRVIVCNNNAVQLEQTRVRLAKMGFEVLTTADGEDALAMAQTLDPVAIVADVFLQRLDGWGLCRAIRRERSLRQLAVVLVTSQYVQSTDRLYALQAGANAYVCRTTDRSEIIHALRSALEHGASVAGAPENGTSSGAHPLRDRNGVSTSPLDQRESTPLRSER